MSSIFCNIVSPSSSISAVMLSDLCSATFFLLSPQTPPSQAAISLQSSVYKSGAETDAAAGASPRAVQAHAEHASTGSVVPVAPAARANALRKYLIHGNLHRNLRLAHPDTGGELLPNSGAAVSPSPSVILLYGSQFPVSFGVIVPLVS